MPDYRPQIGPVAIPTWDRPSEQRRAWRSNSMKPQTPCRPAGVPRHLRSRCRRSDRRARRDRIGRSPSAPILAGDHSRGLTGTRERISRRPVTRVARKMVRAAGLEPAQLFRAQGFSYHFGFRRLALALSRFRLVCGLDYTFAIARLRFRRCPSSLYTFAPAVRPVRLARDCLLPVSPNLSSSAPRVSPWALNLLSPLRLPVPPRPL